MTEPAAARKILVACIGNPDRGDDGIGPLVAAKLEGQLPGDAALIVRRGDMLALAEDFAGCGALVCVDAAAPMSSPGANSPDRSDNRRVAARASIRLHPWLWPRRCD